MGEDVVAPTQERERLDAVRRYDVLETPPDGTFDRITAVAARLFRVPIALVTIVDTDRIWFKSRHGLEIEQVARDRGLCASAILGTEPWLVTDAAIDPRTIANPLVAGQFGLRFYAGAPLRTRDGYGLGTLCIIDREPRELTSEEVATLSDLAEIVMDELELRLAARQASRLESELRLHAETIATALQESLLPPAIMPIEGFDIVGRYHVAQRDVVGGDFYDVIPTDTGAAIIVGDVCGKGTLAASTASTARWILHAVMSEDRNPRAALSRLNALLCQAYGYSGPYVTVAAAALSRRNSQIEITLSLGGHPQPLVLRRDGRFEALGRPGPLVGWFGEARYSSTTALFESGDILVMFTDGLFEAVAGHGESDDRIIRELLSPLAGGPARAIADRLDAAIGTDRRDDAAFIVARVL